ncbi:hypothetical protein [Pedobacter mucosus]|uniref:hypothetical protein n=1 Tax=Pedobacter mucosus TaxID=2895286 RepID=UPI001EE4D19F|nr:hypothetical protein [Pedobacter mucosus]UKT65097.1 hypothetical protein LOK61_04795 [Pedobacter mucosus]
MIFSFKPEPKYSAVALFFQNIQEKIFLYKEHILSTSEIYEQKLAEALTPLHEESNAKLIEVRAKHESVLRENKGNKDAELIALHESGLDDAEGYYQYLEENIQQEHDELHDFFNKSSLIMLYSLLESELKKLCQIMQEIKMSRIGIEHFSNSNYIKGCFNYLDLVIELPAHPLESFQTKISYLQLFRNRIVHSSAELSPNSTNEEKNLLKQALNDAKEAVIISEGQFDNKRTIKIYSKQYLLQSLELIADLFLTLYQIINHENNYLIVKEELLSFFSAEISDIEIIIDSHQHIKNGAKFQFTICQKAKTGGTEIIHLNASVSSAASLEVATINQCKDSKLASEVANQIKKKEKYFASIFKEWTIANPSMSVNITLYE